MLSAGGTGGHVIPAQALSAELISRGYRVEIITDARGMKFTKGFDPKVKLNKISAGTSIKGAPKLILGILQSVVLMIKSRPACVIGFGGYPSFPGSFAAQILLIPNILHESNAILGKANKALGYLATKISLSWESTRGLSEKERAKSIYIGNPLRAEISALADKPYPPVKDTLNILVMGGSLGATVFSEVLPKAFAALPAGQKSRLRVTQQCRAVDIDAAKTAYAAAGINATLATFIDNVPEELASCHLFIGRSGGTVFEITAAGRPAIFVPYPHHADQQQKINADAISDKGGAWTVLEKDFTAKAVKTHIENFMQNPSTLEAAAAKSKACGTPNAAAKLASLVETLINNKG